MTDASPASPGSRQVEPGTRRMMILAGVLNVVVATLILLMAGVARGMANAGRKDEGMLEALIPVLGFFGAPMLAYYLYTSTSADIRWVGAVLWLPLLGSIVGLILIINYA